MILLFLTFTPFGGLRATRLRPCGFTIFFLPSALESIGRQGDFPPPGLQILILKPKVQGVKTHEVCLH